MRVPEFRAGAAALLLAAMMPALLAAAPLSFAEAQRLAVQESRQLAAQDAAITVARELAVVAGERPDPTLSLGIDNLPVNTADRFSLSRDFMTMRRIGLAQELTRRDKLDLRREQRELEAQLADAGKMAERSLILRAAGKAWLESWYLRQMQSLTEAQLVQTRQQLVASEATYRGGRNRQDDVLAARAEVFLLEDRLAELNSRERVATTALARWVGADRARQALAGEPDLTRIHFDMATLAAHLARHPDLVMLDRQIALAETGARLAEADRRADWSVELSYARRGPEFSNMMSLGLSVPLQWDQARRQDRELAARQAQVGQVQASRDDRLRAHVAEVSAMADAWQTGLQRLVRYRTQLLPLAQSRKQAVLASYRGGRAGLTDVLVARRQALDMQLQALQLEMQTALDWVALDFLLPEATGSST